MKRALVAVVAGALLLVSGGGLDASAAPGSSAAAVHTSATAVHTSAVTVHAAVAVTPMTKNKFKNCTAMHKVFKHGVGRKGAKDKVRGKTKPVTTFKVSTKIYKLNKKMDRDKDGVACEKK
jgi:hypothetical protein